MSARLMERIAAEENLYDAWRKVRANQGGPGVDAVRLADFEEDLPRNLGALGKALADETYVPLPLRRVTMPKRGGGERALAIPAVADRVAQRAFVNVLEPVFEPVFLPCSFGYRTGRGVGDAVERVLAYRAAGLDWVLDADVRDFFPSVDHALLMEEVRRRVADRAALRVIALWLEAGTMAAGPAGERPGLLAATAARVRDAVRAVADTGGGERDGDADSWEAARRTESLRRFGAEAARLAWENRRVLLPLLASKSALAFGGAGALALGAAVAADYVRRTRAGGSAGTPQGGPISPLLSNVYLHPFDERITRAGLRLVRYADDFVICCPSEARALQARQAAAAELSRLRLTLHPDKTRILSCRDPLRFLGHEFDGDGAFPVPAGPEGTTETARRLAERAKEAAVRGAGQASQSGKTVVREVGERFSEIRSERRERRRGR